MRKGIIISRASPTDAADIQVFWNPIIRESFVTFTHVQKSTDDIASMIETQPFFVAKHSTQRGAKVVGFATYGPFRGGDGYAHTVEHTVILAPDARGKSIGTCLMNALESDARDNDIHSMIAGVAADNSAALAFHTALGYIKVAHIPEVGRKFDRWLDLVLLQKIL